MGMDYFCDLTSALHFEHAEKIVGGFFKEAAKNKEMIIVATFDVDYLRDINEKYGWAAGDAVLLHLSNICHKYSSIVARKEDEMSVVFKNYSVEEGVKLATDLFKEIQKSKFEFEEVQIPVSVSMGITHNHEGEIESFEEIVSIALCAMAKSKSGGRNRFIMDVAPYM